jgi:hypothetical protein
MASKTRTAGQDEGTSPVDSSTTGPHRHPGQTLNTQGEPFTWKVGPRHTHHAPLGSWSVRVCDSVLVSSLGVHPRAHRTPAVPSRPPGQLARPSRRTGYLMTCLCAGSRAYLPTVVGPRQGTRNRQCVGRGSRRSRALEAGSASARYQPRSIVRAPLSDKINVSIVPNTRASHLRGKRTQTEASRGCVGVV